MKHCAPGAFFYRGGGGREREIEGRPLRVQIKNEDETIKLTACSG